MPPALLGEKISPLFAAHLSNLLVTPCSALVVTLWFLVVIYITRSSVKSDPFTPLPNSSSIPLIATRKKITLSITHCGVPKSVCLLCEVSQ